MKAVTPADIEYAFLFFLDFNRPGSILFILRNGGENHGDLGSSQGLCAVGLVLRQFILQQLNGHL